MNFSGLLAVAIGAVGRIENIVELDWLGKIIQALIEGCGSIGLGIIIFSLCLKLITLPFDVFSRISTKKNAVKMEKMRPELERLQRQYANNKELYNKKLQALYKQNGYSALSACLPTLLTLVIFVVVIGQFSTYSNYANFGVICSMSNAYADTVEKYDENNNVDYIYTDENKNDYLNLKNIYEASAEMKDLGFKCVENNNYDAVFSLNEVNDDNIKILVENMKESGTIDKYGYIIGENGHIIYNESTGKYSFNAEMFGQKEEGGNYSDGEISQKLCNQLIEVLAVKYYDSTVKEEARKAAAMSYRNTSLSFLWVKNIWLQDLPWVHPVRDNFADYGFIKNAGCIASCSSSCSGTNNKIDTVSEAQYTEITANLKEERTQANGYLILVVLSIGTMLISQILMQKTQKAQMELQSVDGENGTAAQTQKMMAWMMPIMFGVFSFMYTASFSIYIIVSSVVSTCSMLIINALVDRKFAKLAKAESDAAEMKRMGHVNAVEVKNIEDKKKQEKKSDEKSSDKKERKDK